MTVTLTRFYELMESDYNRIMAIVNAGQYHAHPDLIKVHPLMCTIFQKGQSLEKLAATWSYDKLVTDGLEVDCLSKSVEALIISAELSHPIHKSMARFLIKYAKRFHEGHVISTSKVIELRFPGKKKEAMDSIIRINQLLLAASNIEDIEGIRETLMLDQAEVGDREKESQKEILPDIAQEMDDNFFELVNPLELGKCIYAFQEVLNQVDFFMCTWFFYDDKAIWIKENCQRFSEHLKNSSFRKSEWFTLKIAKNNMLKQALDSFSHSSLEQDDVLAKVWHGKSLSLFQKYWAGIKEKQEACRKIAIANYFSKIYNILDNHEESVRQAYHHYLHSMHAQNLFLKKPDRVKKSLSYALSGLFISSPDHEIEKLELGWKAFLEECQGLYKQQGQNIVTENQAILAFLKKLGLEEVEECSPLEQDFLILHQMLNKHFLIVTNQESKSATYHPFYSEEIKAKPVEVSRNIVIKPSFKLSFFKNP
jgi:hypothetical protein